MASIDDGELYLWVEGATEPELNSGIVAARASLRESGVCAEEAYWGAQTLAHYQEALAEVGEAAEPITSADEKNADAWIAASRAAVAACCARWPGPSYMAELNLFSQARDNGAGLDSDGGHYELRGAER